MTKFVFRYDLLPSCWNYFIVVQNVLLISICLHCFKMFTDKFIKTSLTLQHRGLNLCIGQVLWPVVCSLRKSVLAKNWQMSKEKDPNLLKDLRNLQKLLKQVWIHYWGLSEHHSFCCMSVLQNRILFALTFLTNLYFILVNRQTGQ